LADALVGASPPLQANAPTASNAAAAIEKRLPISLSIPSNLKGKNRTSVAVRNAVPGTCRGAHVPRVLQSIMASCLTDSIADLRSTNLVGQLRSLLDLKHAPDLI
jgi:hypothetical protein